MAKIDIAKIVPCEDVSKVHPLNKPHLPYNSPVNKKAAEHDGCVGIQEMVDKLRKIYGWHVCSTKWNLADKSCDITTVINSDDTDVLHFSYEAICKELWWHSFEVIGNDTVRPVPFTFEEKEAVMKPKVKKTAKKDSELAASQEPKPEAEPKTA